MLLLRSHTLCPQGSGLRATLLLGVLGAVFVKGHNEAAPLSLVQTHAVRVSSHASASLAAAPASIVPPALVTVSWALDDPSACSTAFSCWIGVYLHGENATLTTPAEYRFVGGGGTRSGEASFRLLNMREDYEFHLFSGGLARPLLLGTSNVVEIAAAALHSPHAGRLSLTHAVDEMVVTWTAKAPSSGGDGVVQIGLMAGRYTRTVTATATSGNIAYPREAMCGDPATTSGWRSPGTFYSAVVSGLAPGTRYYYRYGFAAATTVGLQGGDSSSAAYWSVERSFLSRPGPGSDVELFAFGDLGEVATDGTSAWNKNMPPSQNTTDGMIADLATSGTNYSLVLHNGDISYARGYASQWEIFHEQIEPIATSVPWMVSIGNHERDFHGSGSAVGDTDSGGECGVPAELRFHPTMWQTAADPTSTSVPKKDQPWYAFNYGPLHVVMISTEHAFDHDSAQFKFVQDDLAHVNRTQTPWIIVGGHRPYYISSINFDKPSGDQPVASDLRASFEDMLHNLSAHTPVVQFGAHHHSYQRSCLPGIYQGECVPAGKGGGVVVVNLGMAGAGNSQNIQKPQPSIWAVVDDSHHGYCRIKANATTFRLEYVRGHDRELFDSFTLTAAQP